MSDATKLDYKAAYLDYKETILQLRGLPGGNGAKPALEKLGPISDLLSETYRSLYGKPEDTTT